MSVDRQFPVLMGYLERKERPDCPRSIPWAMLAPHEAQALYNHGQTLERLASRGGLGTGEIIAVLDGKKLRGVYVNGARDVDFVDELKRRVEAFAAVRP